MAIFTYVAAVLTLDLPLRQALAPGFTIAFAGIAGVVGARVVRDAVLQAREATILESYVSRGLIADLRQSGVERTAHEEEVTLLLADIRDFTGLVEPLAPEQAVALLNEYLAVAVPPILAHGGIIDKYVGDGILAFFESADHAARALQAALGLLEALDGFNDRRPAEPPLRCGVALHVGPAMLGTIATVERREYTIISDAVNLTARLEELNERSGSAIVVSASVVAATGGIPAGFSGPETVDLRGHLGRLAVYRLARRQPPSTGASG